MTRYAAKVDANHGEIRDFLRAIPGIGKRGVKDVSGMSKLGCDLIVRYQDGPPHFLEIKAGPKDKLTDSEAGLKAMMEGYWHRVETLDDALAVFGIGAEQAPF